VQPPEKSKKMCIIDLKADLYTPGFAASATTWKFTPIVARKSMMFGVQVNWTGPLDATGQQAARNNFAIGEDSEAAFALIYETILGLSDEQCSQTEVSDNWLGADSDGSLLDPYDSSRRRTGVAMEADALQFTGKGRDSETDLGYLGARYPGSSMGQFVSQGSQVQAGTMPSHRVRIQSAAAETSVIQNGNPIRPTEPDVNIAPSANSTGVLNKSQLSDWMDAHALSRSSHHCAMYCRLGMEAAGLDTGDRPRSGDAGDYGPFLLRHGAQTVPQDSYVPQVGDVVVFDKTGQHPYGHIEMYDGQHWVSDFKQHSFSPYRDAASTPLFTIYRLS
jgi:hypothetical protein